MSETSVLRPKGPGSRTTHRFIARPRLDIIDLRAIETELRVIGPVEVTSEQFEGTASSVDALLGSVVTSLQDLRFSATRPDSDSMLVVHVQPTSAHLAGVDSDPLIAAVFVRVEQLILSRSRRVVSAATGASLPLLGVAVAMVAAVTLLGSYLPYSVAIILLVAIIALMILSLVSGMVGKNAQGEIILVAREDRPTSSQRNKDRLVVGFVAGSAVLGLGFFIGKLTA